MSAVTAKVSKGVDCEALCILADAFDTKKVDDFLDQLFKLADRSGIVVCSLANDRVLRLQSRGVVLQELEIARAKTKLRMVCARLAVRCGEWAKRKISPYGDNIEREVPPANKHFLVRFENSTAVQEITVEMKPTNGV